MESLAGLLLAAAISAAPAPPQDRAQPTPAPASAPAEPAALDPTELERLRGGDANVSVMVTDQTLNAINAGNSVNGQTVSSGQINIGSGAFDGFAGIGNFAINSGHNNNLQSTVSVTVNITPTSAP